MNNCLIQVKNLSKNFGEKTVLKKITFDLKKGEFVSLLGPSGCGKTVLLKIISRLLESSEGTINNSSVTSPNINISMAFQKSPLFQWLNLMENITICMNTGNMSEIEKKETVLKYFERTNLSSFADYFPNQISGGMTQKVNVLRCFCSKSDLILMDEPFVFLDFIQRASLQKFTLDIWKKEKRTILFVTHNIHEAITLSDRILLMSTAPGEMVKEFVINISRPREIEEIRVSKEYIDLYLEINKYLSIEISKFENLSIP